MGMGALPEALGSLGAWELDAESQVQVQGMSSALPLWALVGPFLASCSVQHNPEPLVTLALALIWTFIDTTWFIDTGMDFVVILDALDILVIDITLRSGSRFTILNLGPQGLKYLSLARGVMWLTTTRMDRRCKGSKGRIKGPQVHRKGQRYTGDYLAYEVGRCSQPTRGQVVRQSGLSPHCT
jgi:hypothetical protein